MPDMVYLHTVLLLEKVNWLHAVGGPGEHRTIIVFSWDKWCADASCSW